MVNWTILLSKKENAIVNLASEIISNEGYSFQTLAGFLGLAESVRPAVFYVPLDIKNIQRDYLVAIKLKVTL